MVLRRFVWSVKQRWRLNHVPPRPVLDVINFGGGPCVILDVGANRGGFAGNILLRAPLARVHCFEPNSELSEGLNRTVERFGTLDRRSRCIVNSVGVGSASGQLDLICTQLDAASSFLPVTSATTNGWPMADFSEKGRQAVEVIRLDNYLDRHQISRVKLLKIDVQGYELEVLKGCGERLRDIDHIVAEVQFAQLYDGAPLWHELVAYARDFGLHPVLMDGFCFGPLGEPLQADLLLSQLPAGMHGE